MVNLQPKFGVVVVDVAFKGVVFVPFVAGGGAGVVVAVLFVAVVITFIFVVPFVAAREVFKIAVVSVVAVEVVVVVGDSTIVGAIVVPRMSRPKEN